jgi:hypothetical protein
LVAGMKLDEADPIVFDVASDEYQSILTAEQSSKGNQLTLMDLEIIMCQHWRQINQEKVSNKFDDGEVLLAAFNDKCHRANKCPERSNGKSDAPKAKKTFKKCLKCGKRDHLVKVCWSKNPAKNSEEKGVSNETGAVVVNKKNKDEYLLSTTDKYGLEDPELWIPDTAATVHMTPHKNILGNIKTQSVEDVITMGNGNQERTGVTGDVEGAVKSAEGEKIVRIQGHAFEKWSV